MLDTNTCSFIMRGTPAVIRRLMEADASGGQLVISAIVYSELRDGALGAKASAKHADMVDAFIQRLDGVLAWDAGAVEQTALIRARLRQQGTPIGPTDSAIAGHALALGIPLVTNNVKEFTRVPRLVIEDWTTNSKPWSQ
jgi:tRNA(fMet)-specific endonuclease VapC